MENNVVTKIPTHRISFTIGDLLDFIEKNKLPREGKVLFQRIEDKYFANLGWAVTKVKGEAYYNILQLKKDIIDKEIEMPIPTDEDIANSLDDYVLIETPINFDGENLFLTAHI